MAPESRPPATADAWQVSNPPIFSMGPVRTSLEIFDKVGMAALRERSLRLTGVPGDAARRVTPTAAAGGHAARPGAARCQLSRAIGGAAAPASWRSGCATSTA